MNERSEMHQADCRQTNEILELLAAGDLPEEEALHFLAHLEVCPGCRTVYEQQRKVASIVRSELVGLARLTESTDLWPAVRARLEDPATVGRRGWSRLGWLAPEPVRILTAAAVLTVGLYFLVLWHPPIQQSAADMYPLFESHSVVVTAARIDHQPARVSGVESGDGNTVFLWLEGAR